MKKYIALFAAILLFINIFTGCGGGQQESGQPLQDKTGTAAVEQTGPGNNENEADLASEDAGESQFPLTVKDVKGVEMTIGKKPEKIISLTLGTDEMLFELVDKSRIKAITYLAEDPGLSNIVNIAKAFPVKINTEVEKIISIQPDLVFMADWADEKIVQQLRDAGIIVYTFKTPAGIDEQKANVMEVARLVGEEAKGRELVGWMDEKLKGVEEKVKALPEDKKLTALCLDSFFNTYGTGTTFDDISKRSGLINLASKEGMTGWQQISKEKVVAMNPDIIFLPAWSYQGFDANKFAEDFKMDKSLANVSAVKNGRVYMLPEAHATSVSHNIVLGVEDIAAMAYPKLF